MPYMESVAPDQSAHQSSLDLRATLSAEVFETPFYRFEDSVALRSDSVNVQVVLKLRCPHMAYNNTTCSRIRFNNAEKQVKHLYIVHSS